MSAVLALDEEEFTYSSAQEDARFSRTTTPPSRYAWGAGPKPVQKTVANYISGGSISEGDRTLVVRRRFRVSVQEILVGGRCDGFLAIFNEEPSRIGSGETIDQALEELQQILIDDYEVYVGSEDSMLTEDAKAYKSLLQQLFTEA